MKDGELPIASERARDRPKILLQERVPPVGHASLGGALGSRGFDVTMVNTPAEVRGYIQSQVVDIAIVDVSQAGDPGLGAVRCLSTHPYLGIGVVVDGQAKQQGVDALQAGADVCLVRPIDIELAAATLHSLVRRLSVSARATNRMGPGVHSGPRDHWRLDTVRWQLMSPTGAAIALTASERIVLMTLVAASGEPVGRESLIMALCHDPHHFDPHRLHMLVQRLRQKISNHTPEACPLLTVRGAGYQFIGEGRT